MGRSPRCGVMQLFGQIVPHGARERQCAGLAGASASRHCVRRPAPRLFCQGRTRVPRTPKADAFPCRGRRMPCTEVGELHYSPTATAPQLRCPKEGVVGGSEAAWQQARRWERKARSRRRGACSDGMRIEVAVGFRGPGDNVPWRGRSRRANAGPPGPGERGRPRPAARVADATCGIVWALPAGSPAIGRVRREGAT